MSEMRSKPKLSPLDQHLGTTPEQTRGELMAAGFDPEEAVASMQRLGRTMAARYADQIATERTMNNGLSKGFPMFSEPVAAGSPAWTGSSDQPRDVSVNDLLGASNMKASMWVTVTGWSMRDVGINDGDTVLVNTSQEPNDGDIVVAHLEGEGQVVKRIRMLEGQPIVLESANPDFAPRTIEDASSIRIHGVVVGRVGKL